MGLACPVCAVPHPDGEHLADHVAITAATRAGDHRAWLDEHAPGWESMDRAELGAFVADRAEEVDSVDLHEEIVDHERARERPGALPDEQARALADERTAADDHATDEGADLDAEARSVLAEARELTERMRADDGEPTGADDEE